MESPLPSRCWPKNAGAATKEFQPKGKGILVGHNIFRLGYLGNSVLLVTEDVVRSDYVSGTDKKVSEEMSMGSFTRLGLPLGNVWVVQYENRCDEVDGIEGILLICSDVGVGPKQSYGKFGVF